MNHMRHAKSFTISDEILTEIASTKGTGSTSERVNKLLKRALELERRERLELEAAEFFANDSTDSVRERAAYQKASKEALSRG
jgi:Arc/MetJ family transcription regulator